MNKKMTFIITLPIYSTQILNTTET